MYRAQERMGWMGSLFLAGTAAVLLIACADDLYTECRLDPTSPDIATATCASDDGPPRSCVIDNNIECDTGSCGRFQGSAPFCTKSCTDDSDCPVGQCVEFVFQTGRNYCVQDEMLE